MAGSDPLDLIDGLTTTTDVSKSEARAELLLVPRSFATVAEVAAWNLAGRSVIYIAEYRRFYRKDTSDTTGVVSESLVRDINGLAFKVIDASGERVSFFAHKNGTAQPGIASATETKVTFGTANSNVGGYYDTSTSRFTPPEGYYWFAANVGFNGGLVADNLMFAKIYKNGVEVLNAFQTARASSETLPVTGLVYCDGDDYIEVFARANGSGTKTVNGGETITYFCGVKVDGERGADGNNFDYDLGPVADNTARDALVGVTVGQRVAVSDMGDGRSAVYELTSTGPYVWSDPMIITGATGATGPSPLAALTAWLTATVYSATAPASYVSQGGSSYVCLVAHTSGTFATDLAASKWGLVASKGDTGSTGATGSTGISGTSAAARIRVVAVANVAIATALENADALDGVTLATNDLVLLTAQSTTHENGVYVVPASGAATRHTDFDAYDELPGTLFIVMEGTVYKDTLWQCTSNRGGTIGVTAVAVSQFTSGSSLGTTTNDNAATGYIGEYIESEVLSGSAVSLTTVTVADITSISLSAGDWEVWGTAAFLANSTTTITIIQGWVSDVSATIPTQPNKGGSCNFSVNHTNAFTAPYALPVGRRRFSLASTTLIYLTARAAFAVSTLAAYGIICARRMR